MPLRTGLQRMLVALLLLVLAACSARTETPTPASGPAAVTARAALGDLRTVDPCGLVNRERLASHGEVTQAATVSLDYCLLHLRAGDGSLVQVAVGELAASRPAAEDPIRRRGALRLVQPAPLPGHCARHILFADDIAIEVRADLLRGSPAVGLCGIADAGADAALEIVRRGDVRHRSFPANSLALIDPCTVLDTAVVREIPGLENADAAPSPARHECQWGANEAGSPRVRLIHSAGEPPRVLHGAAVEETIAGRRTITSVVGGDPRMPLCSTETGHVPFGPEGSGDVEVAMIVMTLPGANGIQACEFARGLAERVWPNLPR